MNNALSTSDVEERIARKIDPKTAGGLMISDTAGGLSFANLNQVMEFAKLMAVANIAVPKHLRGSAGACAAVVVQALEWKMSPFAVANKSYAVNDRLAFEAQLVQAVILQRAPIKGRIKVEYAGEGERRVCRVWAELRDEPGEIVEYTSPVFARIQPKNSPLWKNDPDQQLFYFSVRALCRRHFPDVLLGVFAKDELEDSPPMHGTATIVPPTPDLSARLSKLAAGPKPRPEDEDDDDKDEPEEEPDEDGAEDATIDEPPHDEDGVILEALPDPNSPDYKRGVEDKRSGLKKCLSSAIRDNEARFAQWRAGYESEIEASDS